MNAQEIESGTLLIWLVPAPLELNGMEPAALSNVNLERSLKTDYVFAQSDSSNKMADATTDPNVRKDMPGTEKNVKPSPVLLGKLITEAVDVAEPQSMSAPPVPTGMDIDVLLSLTTAQLVWFGKISTASETDPQHALTTASKIWDLAHPFQLNAPTDLPGTTLAAILPQTHAPVDLTTTVSSVSHSCHVLKEESGTTLCLSAFAQLRASTTVKNVSTAPLDNFMPTEDASAPREPSSMECNAPNPPLTDVSVLLTPTGTEPTVFVSLDLRATEIAVSVMVSSWETIVKDAPPSQTPSSQTESVNVILDTLNLTANVF